LPEFFNFPLRRPLIEDFAKENSVDLAAARVREMLSLFGQEASRRTSFCTRFYAGPNETPDSR